MDDRRISRLLHAALGLSSELGELHEGSLVNKPEYNLTEELGDITWYVALACDELGIADDLLIEGIVKEFSPSLTQSVFDYAVIAIGDLSNQAKRVLFYQAPLNIDEYVNDIRRILAFLTRVPNWDEAMRKNILKLAKRYPDRFSTERALIRDLEAEVQVLAE